MSRESRGVASVTGLCLDMSDKIRLHVKSICGEAAASTTPLALDACFVHTPYVEAYLVNSSSNARQRINWF